MIPPDGPQLEAKCLDCGKDYADFPLDVLLPRCQWLDIHPEDGGLLCANCIMARAAKLPNVVGVSAVIMVAPLKEMAENLNPAPPIKIAPPDGPTCPRTCLKLLRR